MRSVFIAWTRYNRRSDLLARHLGAHMEHFAYGRHGDLLRAPLRYLVLSLQTWRSLRRERPELIFVQNPPIFCVLIATLYARRSGARVVIDSHTAAFLSPKWRWSLWLHRLLSRRALATIVTNDALREVVEGWGARSFVIGFTPAEYPDGAPFPFTGPVNAAVVSTGAEDEPLEALFAAAALLPEVSFYISGDTRRVREAVLAAMPPNCHLTGYLPYEQYVGLLRGADLVVDLTTRDHTLLLGAFEAVSLGTPLVISDWPILRSYFSKGTVHVPNTAEGIGEGVRRALGEREALRAGIGELREQLHAEWAGSFAQLRRLLEPAGVGPAAAARLSEERV